MNSGRAVLGTISIATVVVSNGLFTVALDFGSGIFTGPARWFEIGVRTNGSASAYTTAIGAPGPHLYIAQRVKNNRLRIAGGTPGMEVSWQVTGIRQDAWANAHRIPVEEDKPEGERGTYIAPEEHGQPKEKGVSRLRLDRVRGTTNGLHAADARRAEKK